MKNLICWLMLSGCLAANLSAAQAAKIPVVLSTDIGDDIDDTWALALALRSPELDVRLVLGDYGNPLARARLIAKFLEMAGRTQIPVGVGVDVPYQSDFRQAKWIEGYDLDRYPGKVHRDGVQAMIDLVMASPEPVTLLCIGPVPNIAEALRREPRLAQKARFVGMHGSVRVGYGKDSPPTTEWNVRANPAACRAALSASWDITLTPLDTCGLVQLRGKKYAQVRDSSDPMIRALIDNYRVWTDWNASHGQKSANPASASSTLFDCVAVYLAITQELCVMEPLCLRVDDDGFTREDPKARKMKVATSWKNLPAFEDWLVQRLAGKGVAPGQNAKAAAVDIMLNTAGASPLPRGRGLAEKFTADAGIAAHPAVIFADDFEVGELGQRWDEKGSTKGKALSLAPAGGHVCGKQCMKVEARLGENHGDGLTKWFEPAGTVFVRFYVRFDASCDYVHHFVTLRANKGLRGGDKWSGFGGAGLCPKGDERFSTALEPTGNWARWPAPGKWNFYSYWHEMKISRDGKYWGNSFLPEPQDVIPKEQWICAEFMLKHNTPGQPDGEHAFWIDGRLLGHWCGINWRKTEALQANALTLEAYITDRWTQNPTNIVYFDNLVIAREYIGPARQS